MRDLLRRRTNLVRQRTTLILSFKSLYTRTTGQPMPLSQLKGMEPKEGKDLYEHPANQLIAQVQLEHIEALDREHQPDRESRAGLRAADRALPKAFDPARGRQDPGHDHHDGGGGHRAL